MKLLFWILGIPLIVAIVAFATSNRAPVTLDLWPFPFAVEPPAYAVIFGASFIGFLAGGAYAWTSATKKRRRARADGRRTKFLERENEDFRRQLAAAEVHRTGTGPGAAEAMEARRLAAGDTD
ncbi:MAG: DUF1049 domain-containing protein [Proteobacteria bacterium]|nr:DUF1049 domain-containing protein [Pseudomonadota bacterium]